MTSPNKVTNNSNLYRPNPKYQNNPNTNYNKLPNRSNAYLKNNPGDGQKRFQKGTIYGPKKQPPTQQYQQYPRKNGQGLKNSPKDSNVYRYKPPQTKIQQPSNKQNVYPYYRSNSFKSYSNPNKQQNYQPYNYKRSYPTYKQQTPSYSPKHYKKR